MAPSSRDLLLAYRWPAAVVLSTVMLSLAGLRLFSRPIPIAIEGGLQVDKLVLPPSVTIRSVTLAGRGAGASEHLRRCAPVD